MSESGELYCWGHGKDGQLGHGDLKDGLGGVTTWDPGYEWISMDVWDVD